MKIIDLEQRSEAWHQFRLGKITGTRLGTIWSARQYTKGDVEKLLADRQVDLKAYKEEIGKKGALTKGDLEKLLTEADREELSTDSEKKLEFYQILADQVAVMPVDEDAGRWRSMMDRGTEKEDEAAELFGKTFNKELMIVGCVQSDEDDRIINSPDRLIKPEGKGRIIREALEVKCLASAKHLMAFFERKIPEEYWTQKVQYFVTNERLETLYWEFYDPRIPMLPMFVLVVKREDLGHWPETMMKYQKRTLKEIDHLTMRLFEEAGKAVMLPARPEKVAELVEAK
jgi:hypothetical protein